MSTDDVSTDLGPVTKSYCKDQLVERAKEYMRVSFGNPSSMEPAQRDKYYERLGLLLMYVDHVWEPFSE